MSLYICTCTGQKCMKMKTMWCQNNMSVRIIYLHNAGGVISSRVLLLCIPRGTSLVGRGDHILTNMHYLKNHLHLHTVLKLYFNMYVHFTLLKSKKCFDLNPCAHDIHISVDIIIIMIILKLAIIHCRSNNEHTYIINHTLLFES
jgi:hypothetical protein